MFEENKLYEVYCNVTSDEFWLKIPQEGKNKCVQVSCVTANLTTCLLQDLGGLYVI